MQIRVPDKSIVQPHAPADKFFLKVVNFELFLSDAAYDLEALYAYLNEFDPKRAEKFKWDAVNSLEDLHDQTRVEFWNLIKHMQKQYAFKPAYFEEVVRQRLRALSDDLQKTNLKHD